MAALCKAFNLHRWIDEHRDLLTPTSGATTVWKDSQFLIMIIGGPHALRSFHINPSDEFYYQLQGDMALDYIDPTGKRQTENIREGDILLMPANTPHSPRRIANTVGLVVERVRNSDEKESCLWYCESCETMLYEVVRSKDDPVFSLSKISKTFNANQSLRTCRQCGHVHGTRA